MERAGSRIILSRSLAGKGMGLGKYAPTSRVSRDSPPLMSESLSFANVLRQRLSELDSNQRAS